MKTHEEILFDKWIRELRKGSTYNRKRWHSFADYEALREDLQLNGIKVFLEMGTANGVGAVNAALAGAWVHTTDLVKSPQIIEEPSFPLPHLDRFIQTHHIDAETWLDRLSDRQVLNAKVALFIDYPMTKSSIGNILPSLNNFLNPGDMVYSKNQQVIDLFHRNDMVGDMIGSKIGAFRYRDILI